MPDDPSKSHFNADVRAMFPRLWTHRAAPWGALSVAALLLVLGRLFVDLSPTVESDFFFSESDPQLRASLEIQERYPSSPQIIVRTRDGADDERAYLERLEALTADLYSVEGITGGYSVVTEDRGSPLFGRLLLNPDSATTNVVLQADGTDPEVLVPRLEAVLERHREPQLELVMSGVPVIVELIRRSLFRDLLVFSTAALLVFGGLMTLAYRDAAVVLGAVVTCAASVSGTLLVTRALDIGVGLLTANIITIVFVLTLSHIVFLTGNWRGALADDPDRATAVPRAVRLTLEASFWSMATTFLGFASLLITSAKPLRELGIAGALGALIALGVAYALYPTFLSRWARPPAGPEATPRPLPLPLTDSRVRLGAVGVIVVALGVGVLRLDTDPGLLTYFAPGSEIREGLELVDRDGGSSTLSLSVRDAEGARIDDGAVVDKLWALQDSLESDPAVGVVLSPATLLGHARRQPLARFLPYSVLMDLAQSPQLDEVGLSFATGERDQGLFFMRMRESADAGARRDVMERVSRYTDQVGLETVVVGGLYDLQAQLGTLIAQSLRIGLTGLLLLFLGIAGVVSRSVSRALAMVVCLSGIPLVVLGSFGHLGIAVDIITSPAANVALAMGVDSMVHLVVRVRKLELGGFGSSEAWARARASIGRPILLATLLIGTGFGIFVLSSFPPTRRFGLAVILGTATAAAMALVVLPGWALSRSRPPPP